MGLLFNLRRNAEGILKNDFSLTYRAAAEGDQTNLSAHFALRDSVSFTGNPYELGYFVALSFNLLGQKG